MRKVVILTALPVEFKAVQAYLTDTYEDVHRNGNIYIRGLFRTERSGWEVAVMQLGMGNNTAALAAQEAILSIAPEMLFFVGIAGGLKDVEPGDVVAADKVYEYASGKDDGRFSPRPEMGRSAHLLVQRARAVAVNDKWQERIRNPRLASPKALIGAIAAGEQVLASKDSATWKLLQAYYSDAKAIEMEGYGTLDAVYRSSPVESPVSAIVIRGISDTLDNKAELDKLNYQEVAASHASAFAFEMLAALADSAPPETAISHPTQTVENPVFSPYGASDQPRPPAPGPARIFYSYAPEDQLLIDKLKGQLAWQRRKKNIQEWDPSLIRVGENSQQLIDQHIQQDDIFVLGLSSAYLGSEDHYDQMEAILQQRKTRSAIVIPIQLHAIDTGDLPTEDLIFLPRSKKPVDEKPEDHLAEVAAEIRACVERRASG